MRNPVSEIPGGKGIRTPDFQLAKLALYQLSYAPERIAECRFAICDCKGNKMPDVDVAIVIRHFVRFSEGEIDLSEASPETLASRLRNRESVRRSRQLH